MINDISTSCSVRNSVHNEIKSYQVIKEGLSLPPLTITTQELVTCVIKSNIYLRELNALFSELEFDVFARLGQRNISGFIGEIFGRFLSLQSPDLIANPHPDGRPDVLFLTTPESREYFLKRCFEHRNGRKLPLKASLTPFPHGGLEIKSSIGNQDAGSKRSLFSETGETDFKIGTERIKYITGLTYWAHHRHSTNLLGLYYDYYSPSANIPQILAVFFCQLQEADWNEVSTGNPLAKKTSNTSLNAMGVRKLYQGCFLIKNDPTYLEQFRRMGVAL